jgi:SAM-dependent methyltransferase
MKLNLGAGTDIKTGFVNHDITKLDGIDIVHDLNIFPWPWGDDTFDEILMFDVLEHLDRTLKSIDEIHRILKPRGVITIKVPYWNSSYFYMDPTHVRGFHEGLFHFFDPSKFLCKQRPYYSASRFEIVEETFILIPFLPYLKLPFIDKIFIKHPLLKRVVGFFGNIFNNIILDLRVKLKKVAE